MYKPGEIGILTVDENKEKDKGKDKERDIVENIERDIDKDIVEEKEKDKEKEETNPPTATILVLNEYKNEEELSANPEFMSAMRHREDYAASKTSFDA